MQNRFPNFHLSMHFRTEDFVRLFVFLTNKLYNKLHCTKLTINLVVWEKPLHCASILNCCLFLRGSILLNTLISLTRKFLLTVNNHLLMIFIFNIHLTVIKYNNKSTGSKAFWLISKIYLRLITKIRKLVTKMALAI